MDGGERARQSQIDDAHQTAEVALTLRLHERAY